MRSLILTDPVFLATLFLVAGLLAGVPAAAQKLPDAPTVISTGKAVTLLDHLRKEGTTVVLFMNDTSAIEQSFLADLKKRLPMEGALALRVVKLKSLAAPAAEQHKITATPTVIVLDRFGRTLARTDDPAQVDEAIRKGLRMARIKWIDEEDPKAPAVYGAPAGALKQGLPGIVKTMSLRPETMRVLMMLSQIHFSDGFLDRRTHEMIAAYVSSLNKCKF